MKCHKGFELGIDTEEIDGKVYCLLAALFVPHGNEECETCQGEGIGPVTRGEMKPCETCGKEMDKYNYRGVEYKICGDCADKLPKDHPSFDIFGPFQEEEK